MGTVDHAAERRKAIVQTAYERAIAEQFDRTLEVTGARGRRTRFAATHVRDSEFAVIVLTELWDNPGQSITELAAEAARRAHAELAADLPIEEVVFLEHYGPISYVDGRHSHTVEHIPIDRHGQRCGGWRKVHEVDLEGDARRNRHTKTRHNPPTKQHRSTGS